jgi:hypothetical protein
MARRLRPNLNTGSSKYIRQAWTTTPAAYDILASGPGGSDTTEGLACRWIIVGTAGTLVLSLPDGQSDQTIYAPAGAKIEIQATALGAASTAQQVVVYW